MKPRLAELETLTIRLDGKGDPTLVAHVLEAATARAEEKAGRELRRALRTEYPYPAEITRELALRVRPVESVSSIVQLSASGRPGTEAEFDAADALTEYEDYYVDERTGIVEHQNSYWAMRRGLVRVVYTGGYLDPDGIAGTFTGAATQGSATFAIDTAVEVGDEVVLGTTGERVTVGAYAAGTVTIADGGTLANAYASGDVIAHYPGDAVLPPNHLQESIILQAIWFYNTADTAGIESIDLGDAGGNLNFGQVKTHPDLIASVQKLPGRRYTT